MSPGFGDMGYHEPTPETCFPERTLNSVKGKSKDLP
jgi:hypothetical protein